MNTLIICEGPSDQILLSYYLCKRYNLSWKKDLDLLPGMPPGTPQPALYANDEHSLVIMPAGSVTQLAHTLRCALDTLKKNTPAWTFSNLILLFDHDSDKESTQLLSDFSSSVRSFSPTAADLRPQVLMACEIELAFGEFLTLNLMPLPLPEHGDGALETFLFNELSQHSENELLCAESSAFIERLLELKAQGCNFPYLHTRRLQVKAPLSVFFAVFSPERVFEKMDCLLRSIPWEEYLKHNRAFRLFDRFFSASQAE